MIVYIFGVIDFFCMVNLMLKRIVDDNENDFDFIILEILRCNCYVDDVLWSSIYVFMLEVVIKLLK